MIRLRISNDFLWEFIVRFKPHIYNYQRLEIALFELLYFNQEKMKFTIAIVAILAAAGIVEAVALNSFTQLDA